MFVSEGFTNYTTRRLPSISDVRDIAVNGLDHSTSYHACMLQNYYPDGGCVD